MTAKIKSVQLSFLMALLFGLMVASPITMVERPATGEGNMLVYNDPGVFLMGECAGEAGTCG